MPIYGYGIHPHSDVILHQTENKRMKPKTELPEELCADEAVCFIADRHHVTPRQLLRNFLYEEIPANIVAPAMRAILLEPNEIEILKGLSEQVKEEKLTNINTR